MKRSLLIMLIVPFFWALNFVFSKYLIGFLPPFSITGGRFTVAGILFMLWIILKKKRLPEGDPSLYLYLFVIGFSGVFAFNSILYIGLQHTSVVNATLINAFNPVATIILAVLILREKVSGPQYAGAALSIIGVFFIMSSGRLNFINRVNLGDIIIFGNTFVWAFYSVIGKKVMGKLQPLETIAFSTLMALPFLWLATAIEVHVYQVSSLPWTAVFLLLFLGIFASMLANIWWYEGIKDLGASGAASFYNLIPLYSLLISWLYLNESIYSYQIIGGLMIIGGVLLSSLALSNGIPAVKSESGLGNKK
ncbi:MAG: DMT family transporter [Syntrophomonas sp.]